MNITVMVSRQYLKSWLLLTASFFVRYTQPDMPLRCYLLQVYVARYGITLASSVAPVTHGDPGSSYYTLLRTKQTFEMCSYLNPIGAFLSRFSTSFIDS